MTDAAWKAHPSSRDYDHDGNWSVAVPTGTATFGASSIHALAFSVADTIVGEWLFTKHAANYDFAIADGQEFTFIDAGISVQGGSVTIKNHGTLKFHNGSSADRAHIQSASAIQFEDSSSAGSAHLTVTSGQVSFSGTATAESATIVNEGGAIFFYDGSNAGTAHISSKPNGSSHAVKPDIVANEVLFEDNSSAKNAVIAGASVGFDGDSTGDNARLIGKVQGVVDFSASLGPGENGIIAAGSIEGAGTFYLGSDNVYVGSNNRSTTVSGLITDGGLGGGIEGVLLKVGTGTMTLSHKGGNSYTGGTVLEGGTLNVASHGAVGNNEITFTDGVQTLKLANAALTGHQFSNFIDEFGVGDRIDFSGLRFVTHAKASFDSGTDILSVKSGNVTDKLTMTDLASLNFQVKNDGHGGTELILQPASPEKLETSVHDERADGTQLDSRQDAAHHDFIL